MPPRLPEQERLFLQVSPGLEPAVLGELAALGLEARSVQGGIESAGPAGTHQRLNLHLRSAERVFLELGTARDVRGWASIPLRAVWDGKARMVGRVSGKGAEVDVIAAASNAWGAPVESARQAHEGEDSEPGIGLRFRLEGSSCSVSVDTTGELLYRRGYRQEISRAPMRETLAAGLLWLAGFRGAGPVWDPMCGSGTLVLEAARWARRIAPGGERSFAFEQFAGVDRAAWERVKSEARAQVLPRAVDRIRGSDLHAGSLGVARRNGRRAGVLEDLVLERLDATKLPPPLAPTGLMIANLPYGTRVGERGELEGLYRGFFASVRARCPGWALAVYVEDAERVERNAGMDFSSRHSVSNGGIRCTLLVGHVR